jgi:hypothetical protein
MKAISIRQPWAWLIVQGYKDVENRTWATKYRGPILIHAGKTCDPAFDELRQMLREEFDIHVPPRKQIPRGGVVGQATIVDCVTDYDSDFFVGPYGFVLEDAQPLPFQPCRGWLGIFDL